ncbi:protease serine 11B-like protein [Seminavis robusta]|uniref:Protease serine 11B-like protein n=1 Tax=Seminavis robusta TaxID=568900 RepID=A0A9N8EUR9_9STRA|nr:protease serine 11B-like protein [Seminavis robusta]|eukprot:Sro1748_g295110.1 protease serine 11B-like protein (664) ;mRNA; r:5169-7798
MKFLSFFLLPVLASASPRNLRAKIVNGDQVAQAEPFFGFFEVGCGVSIVAPDMLLTAAHCENWDILRRRVWLGSTELYNGTVRTVLDRIPHPDYREDSTGEYDIMLMKVNASMFFEADGVTPTALEKINLNDNDLIPTAAEQLRVIGHGRTSFADTDTSELEVVPESMFCAGQGPQGFGGSCNGDSGGPVIDPVTGVQVGIVSWGHACSRYGYPSVFGRVSSAYDWINDAICQNPCFPDPSLCGDTVSFHPCGGAGVLSNGTIGLNLTVVSDSFPGEIAFALEHVEYGLEVYFQPYDTYSYADVAGLGYGEDFIIQHSFENLPNGTYHLTLGDADYDGICYGYSTCLDQENVILSFLDSKESIWTHSGDYYSGTDIYIRFDSDGSVVFVSEYPEGVAPPTPAPTETPIISYDYPGDFPDGPSEVIVNEGPSGLEWGSNLYSYNQSNLRPETLYRFLFFDSLGDGIFTWGVSITNSSASVDYTDGTVLWTLPNSFRTFSEVYVWIDAQGNSEVIDFVKVPAARFYLGAACSRISLTTELGTSICEDACSRGDCCWNTTSGTLCTSYQSECGNYAKCSNLLVLGDDAITTDDVSEACRNHAAQVSQSISETLCDIICESGECCFDDEVECDADVDCDVFEPCSVVFEEEDLAVEAVERKPRRPPY